MNVGDIVSYEYIAPGGVWAWSLGTVKTEAHDGIVELYSWSDASTGCSKPDPKVAAAQHRVDDLLREATLQDEEAWSLESEMEQHLAHAQEAQRVSEKQYEEAKDAVLSIENSQLHELRSYINPPKVVKLTLAAVLQLLGIAPDIDTWENVQRAIRGPDFIESVCSFDPSHEMTNPNASVLRCISDPQMKLEAVYQASQAAGPLLHWLHAKIGVTSATKALKTFENEAMLTAMKIRAARSLAATCRHEAEQLQSEITPLQKKMEDRRHVTFALTTPRPGSKDSSITSTTWCLNVNYTIAILASSVLTTLAQGGDANVRKLSNAEILKVIQAHDRRMQCNDKRSPARADSDAGYQEKYQMLLDQFAIKELQEHELGVRNRELQADLRELENAQQKLAVANRNARVLEEENDSLIRKLKGIGSSDPTQDFPISVGAEAAALIRDNEVLSEDVKALQQAMKELSQKHKASHAATDEKILENQENIEMLQKQLAAYENKNERLQRSLDDTLQILEAEHQAWEEEKRLLEQERDALHANVHRLETSFSKRSLNASKAHDKSVTEGEVSLLRIQLDEAEQLIETSTADWKVRERALEDEIEALGQEIASQPNDAADSQKAIVMALREQLMIAQREISNLRSQHAFPSEYFSPQDQPDDEHYDDKERIAQLEQEIRELQQYHTEVIADFELQQQRLNDENHSLTLLVEDLRRCLLDAQHELTRKQELVDEQRIDIRELKIELAAVQKISDQAIRQLEDEKYSSAQHRSLQESEGTIHDEDVKRLLVRVAKLQSELNKREAELADQKLLHEQVVSLNEAHVGELEAQLEELAGCSDDLRRGNKNIDDGRSIGADVEMISPSLSQRQENSELMKKLADANSLRAKNIEEFAVSLAQVQRDKRDAIDDLMRQLETAWASEEDHRRQLRRLQGQHAECLSIISTLEDQCNSLSGERDGELQKLRDIKEERDAFYRQKLMSIANEKEDATSQLRRVTAANTEREAQLAELRERLRSTEEGRAGNTEALRSQLDEYRRRVTLLTDECHDQRKSQREAQDALQASEKRIAALEQQLKEQEKGSRPPSIRAEALPVAMRSQRRVESMVNSVPRSMSAQSQEERRRKAVPDGAHLAVTIVEISDLMRNGRPIIEPGYVIIKLKSIKEKYKTSVKDLTSVIRFNEQFAFHLARPDQDIISLHVFYKPKSGREFHIGDVAFSMATLCRGLSRNRVAPLVQNAGTSEAQRAGQVEVIMQTDDFGRLLAPTDAEIAAERRQFNDLVAKLEVSAPEKLHAADVHLACGQ